MFEIKSGSKIRLKSLVSSVCTYYTFERVQILRDDSVTKKRERKGEREKENSAFLHFVNRIMLRVVEFSLRYVGHAAKLIKIAVECKLLALNCFAKNFSSNGMHGVVPKILSVRLCTGDTSETLMVFDNKVGNFCHGYADTGRHCCIIH